MRRRSVLGGLGGFLSLPVLQSSTNNDEAGMPPRARSPETSQEVYREPDQNVSLIGSLDELLDDSNSGTLVLTDDIDGGGTTISDSTEPIQSIYGQGYTIENINVENENLITTRFFNESTEEDGVINNIKFKNITIDPSVDNPRAGIVKYDDIFGVHPAVTNCVFEDIKITRGVFVGCVEGWLARPVRNCIFRDITELQTIGESYYNDDGEGPFSPVIGIVAGSGYRISNCLTTGELKPQSTTNDHCGGVVGSNYWNNTIQNCISIVNVDSPNTYSGIYPEGGIAGSNCLLQDGGIRSDSGGTISNCYHPTEVPPDSATNFNADNSVDVSFQVPTADLQGDSPSQKINLDFQNEWQTKLSYAEPIQDPVDLTSQRIYADGVDNIIINDNGEQIVIHG